jgi:hydroxysqualene synthase
MTSWLLFYGKYNVLLTCGQNPLMPNHHRNTTTPPPAQAVPIKHYENFPVASYLCPVQLRVPVAAIYHFARTADDIADEGTATPQQRLDTLRDYRHHLMVASGNVNTAAGITPYQHEWQNTFQALQQAIATHRLPVQLLHDLLDAFVQDIEKSRDGAHYATDAELLDYCRRSANPVGRLLLHLYGVTDTESLQQSDNICTALQLINFWQDLSRDIPRGRYYLPQDTCTQFGTTHMAMVAGTQTNQATKLIAYYTRAARVRMQKGAPLVHRIPGRAGWELRLVVQGGLRILDKIEAAGFNTLTHRPITRWWDAPVMLWRAIWM